MPEGVPPLVNPDADDGLSLDEAVAEATLAILAHRHHIPAWMVKELLDEDTALRAEYDTLIDEMTKNRPQQPSEWQSRGTLYFDVTESPEGEVLQHGKRYAVISKYHFHFVPNKPAPRRRSVASWAWNYGQPRGQS